MSSNIAEVAIEVPPRSNQLDVIPGEMSFDAPLRSPNITRASPGGYSSRCGGGQTREPVVDTEPSRTRADQPDKEEYVQNFRKVKEVVEPV